MTQRLAFWEIGKGNFAKGVQNDFVEAQRLSIARNMPIAIKMEIIVHPPQPDDKNFGNIEFKHELKQPAQKSVKYITELREGTIVKDANDELDLLQLGLDLSEPDNVKHLNLREKNGTE